MPHDLMVKAEEATEVWKVKQQEAEEALALAQMLVTILFHTHIFYIIV